MAIGMGSGFVLPQDRTPPPNSWMKPTNSPIGLYSGAVNQQNSDYDKIMGNYDALYKSAKEQGNKPNLNISPLNHQNVGYEAIGPYSPSPGMSNLKSKLQENSNTGGFSEEELSSLRARGVSPIRAIYAGALRNLQRQKSLSGGYAPNYGALQAKLAREQSMQVGEANMKVNADITDRVSQGRQAALSMLTPLMSQENQMTNNINTANAQGVQRVNELNTAENTRVDEINRQMQLALEQLSNSNHNNSLSQGMQATQGMQSIYGTTPALSNMFGNQVLASNAQNLQAQQAGANVNQNRANTGMDLVSALPQPRRNTGGGSGFVVPQ